MTAQFPYTLQWAALSPSKLPLPMAALSNTWFLGPTWLLNQTACRSVQPFLQGSLVSDRPTTQTDRPH